MVKKCRDCGTNHSGKNKLCDVCSKKARDSVRNRSMRLIESGLCGECGKNKNIHGKIRCTKCTDRMKKNNKKRIKKYIKNNCCGRCGRDKSKIEPWPYRDCAGCQLKFKFNFLGTKQEAEAIINKILIAQNFRCALTGRCLKENKYHIDHINPKSLGGIDDKSNWQLIVDEANVFKTNMTMGKVLKLALDIVNYNKTSSDVFSTKEQYSCSNNSIQNTRPNIYNAHDCFDSDIIIYKGNKLTSQFIKSTPIEYREKIALSLLEYFCKRDFYETKIEYKKVENDWKKLQNNSVQMVNNIIATSPSTGNHIYKYFFPNMLKISTKSGRSVYDVVQDKDLLLKVIRNRLGIGYKEVFNITTNMIKQGAKSTGLASHGSQFKPLVAKAVYDKYVKDGDNVLDYSCGFGSRMLGLMATGKDVKYFGFEPSIETYNNLLRLGAHFDFNIHIKNCGSETDRFNSKMNFVFSSPPYFDHEVYCDEQTQCYNKYQNYMDWIEKYWRETVINIRDMMADDAVFGANIGNNSNKKMIKIAKDMLNVIDQEGFCLTDVITMRNPISHLANKANKNKKFKEDYIHIYTKNSV